MSAALDPSDVSVVVIVRDGEAYLADALASLRDPAAPPGEIIVVDGHSSDRTAAIARAVPGVTVVTQRSRGIASAYNEGIALARGSLVAFCSHDDVWLPGKLPAQLRALAADPDAGFCVTLVQHVLADGAVPPPGFRGALLEHPVPGVIPECLLVRRETLRRVGPFDPSFSVGEDTDWFARARDLGVRHVVVPEVLVHKRVHGGNASLTEPDGGRIALRLLRQSIARKRAAAGGAEPRA